MRILGVLVLALVSCTTRLSNDLPESAANALPVVIAEVEEIKESPASWWVKCKHWADSIAATIDTTTLEGKREYIMNRFIREYDCLSPDSDTLVDLNYDGYPDYVIWYYGLAGTGVKNRAHVHFFNPETGLYDFNELFSYNMANHSLFLDRKKITCFYLPHGAGSCKEYEWIDDQWTLTKYVSIHNDGDTSKWYINYPLTGKNEVLIQAYALTPPENIIETKWSW